MSTASRTLSFAFLSFTCDISRQVLPRGADCSRSRIPEINLDDRMRSATISAASPPLGPHGPRLGRCSRAPAVRCCFDEEIANFAHRTLAYRGSRARKVALNDVPV